MKLRTLLPVSLLLSSCAADYTSPRTGIRYKFEVPATAFSDLLPDGVKFSATKGEPAVKEDAEVKPTK